MHLDNVFNIRQKEQSHSFPTFPLPSPYLLLTFSLPSPCMFPLYRHGENKAKVERKRNMGQNSL
ncbi:hypothetical protein Buni01_02587 [Bacteroides uniformis]